MTEMNPLFQGTLVPCLVMEKVRQTDGYRSKLHSRHESGDRINRVLDKML